jgi:hypothetical protein
MKLGPCRCKEAYRDQKFDIISIFIVFIAYNRNMAANGNQRNRNKKIDVHDAIEG